MENPLAKCEPTVVKKSSIEERTKLVVMVEARPQRPDALRVGQPVSVALTSSEAQP